MAGFEKLKFDPTKVRTGLFDRTEQPDLFQEPAVPMPAPVTEPSKAAEPFRFNPANVVGAPKIPTIPSVPEPEDDILGFLDAFKGKGLTDYLPFVASGVEAKELYDLYNAAQRVESGTESEEDVTKLKDYIDREGKEKSWGYTVGAILQQLPSFMGEIIATSGIFAAGRSVGVKAAAKALKSMLSKEARQRINKRALRIGLEAAGVGVGGTLQAFPAGVTRITANTVRNMMPGLGLSEDEAGQVAILVEPEKGDRFWSAFAKGAGEQWAEIVSEQTGILFSMLGRPIKESLIKTGILGSFMKANPGAKVQEFEKLVRKFGWHGIINEMLEERAGEALRAGIRIEDYRLPTLDQLLAELVAFSVPGAAFAAAGAGPSAKMRRAVEGVKLPEVKPSKAKSLKKKIAGLEKLKKEIVESSTKEEVIEKSDAVAEQEVAKVEPAKPPTFEENPYMKMSIERVRQDAMHGVKLAKEALSFRKAEEAKLFKKEPVKPTRAEPEYDVDKMTEEEAKAALAKTTEEYKEEKAKAGGKDFDAIRGWAGNTKVLDKAGDPAIVYHWTEKPVGELDISRQPSGSEAMFFGNLSMVNYYAFGKRPPGVEADPDWAERPLVGAIYPVYLKIENPAPPELRDTHSIAEIKGMGYDGIIDDRYSGPMVEYAVFDNSQMLPAFDRSIFKSSTKKIKQAVPLEGPKGLEGSVAGRFKSGLYAGSIFEGGEVDPRNPSHLAAWRSMGQKEYDKLIAGKKSGGIENAGKRGHYFSWFPSLSANLKGKKGKPKYLVEFAGVDSEGETTKRPVGIEDVSAVWKSEGGEWERIRIEREEETKKAERAVVPEKISTKIEKAKAEKPADFEEVTVPQDVTPTAPIAVEITERFEKLRDDVDDMFFGVTKVTPEEVRRAGNEVIALNILIKDDAFRNSMEAFDYFWTLDKLHRAIRQVDGLLEREKLNAKISGLHDVLESIRKDVEKRIPPEEYAFEPEAPIVDELAELDKRLEEERELSQILTPPRRKPMVDDSFGFESGGKSKDQKVREWLGLPPSTPLSQYMNIEYINARLDILKKEMESFNTAGKELIEGIGGVPIIAKKQKLHIHKLMKWLESSRFKQRQDPVASMAISKIIDGTLLGDKHIRQLISAVETWYGHIPRNQRKETRKWADWVREDKADKIKDPEIRKIMIEVVKLFDSIREDIKTHFINEMVNHLSDRHIRALQMRIHGFSEDDIKRRFPRINIGQVNDNYQRIKDIETWGLEDYITNIELGSYKIIAIIEEIDADGTPRQTPHIIGIGATKHAAIEKAKKLRKELEGKEDRNIVRIEIDSDFMHLRHDTPLFQILTGKRYRAQVNEIAEKLAVDAKALADELGEIQVIVPSEVKRKTPTKKFAGPFIRRKARGLAGEEDVFKALFSYIHVVYKKIHLDPAITYAQSVIRKLSAEAQEDVLDTIEAAKGKYWIEDQIVDSIMARLPIIGKYIKPHVYSRRVSDARWLSGRLKLGYRPVAGIVNYFGGMGHVYVKLGAEYTMKGRAWIKTDEGRKFIERVEHSFGTGFGEAEGGRVKASSIWSIFKPMGFFQLPEYHVRSVAAGASYLWSRDLGYSDYEATEISKRFIDTTQYLYNTVAIPKILRSPTGRLLGQFKVYPIKEMEFISGLSPVEWLRYIGYFMAIAGPLGITYIMRSIPILGVLAWFQWGDDIEKWLNGYGPWRDRAEVARWSRGLIPGIFNVDITAPATFQFPVRPEDFAGPFISDIIRAFVEIAMPYAKGEYYVTDFDYVPPDFSKLEDKEGIEYVAGVFKALRDSYVGSDFGNVGEWLKGLAPAIIYWDTLVESTYRDGWLLDSRGKKLKKIDSMWERAALIAGAKPTTEARRRLAQRLHASEMEIHRKNVSKTKEQAMRELRARGTLLPKTVAKIKILGIRPEEITAFAKEQEFPEEVRRVIRTKLMLRPKALEGTSIGR